MDFQGRASSLHTPYGSKSRRRLLELKSYRITSSPGNACLEAEVGWEWSDSVGVGLLGHTDPRSLVQNLHGTARLVCQQRGSRIGTCHTLG